LAPGALIFEHSRSYLSRALVEDNRLNWPAGAVRPPEMLSSDCHVRRAFGFYVAGYTGVFAVTNCPIWSDNRHWARFYRFGRIHIGGIDDTAGAQVRPRHVRR
jgi:hypothetical protein